jgi:glycosyltransferase involved in cell wall biosynthesis
MFTNKVNLNYNSENFFKWIFRRRDELKSIVFVFISQINANNARYYPLFQNTQEVRIVYFIGLPIKYSDRVLLRIFKISQLILKLKIAQYQKIHFFNIDMNFNNEIQILHMDDPVYSGENIKKINVWAKRNLSKNRLSKIVCTNTFTENWLKINTEFADIVIIEQGFDYLVPLSKPISRTTFICAYSSPYICYGNDKDSNHTTYGAKTLFDEIIPSLFKLDSTILVYLIGKLGKDAKKAAIKYPNLVLFGQVSAGQNLEILSNCDVGIYPRKFDHKRSVLKIFTYIGAGLPIVTFDLIDTEIVKRKELGFSVSNSKQFVEKIIELKNTPDLFKVFQANVKLQQEVYSWGYLARKMEKSV